MPIIAEAKTFGATIASDGWSDMHRCPILNVIIVTRGAAVFMRSIDGTDHMAEGGRKTFRLALRVLSRDQCN